MSLAYCPTDAMVADYFTKPLQGAKIRKFCTMIMNSQDPALELMSQECVGASPPEVNPEEKDSIAFELANSRKETSAQVQLDPGTQIQKNSLTKLAFMGGSKEFAKNSRSAKNDVVNEGYTRRMFKQDPIDGFYPQGVTPCGENKDCIYWCLLPPSHLPTIIVLGHEAATIVRRSHCDRVVSTGCWVVVLVDLLL